MAETDTDSRVGDRRVSVTIDIARGALFNNGLELLLMSAMNMSPEVR